MLYIGKKRRICMLDVVCWWNVVNFIHGMLDVVFDFIFYVVVESVILL